MHTAVEATMHTALITMLAIEVGAIGGGGGVGSLREGNSGREGMGVCE